MALKLASFNLLADGLAAGEFMTDHGDEAVVHWDVRGPKVCDVMKELMTSAALVVTQENDHFYDILHSLRQSGRNIHALYNMEKDNMDTADFKVEKLWITDAFIAHTGNPPSGKFPKGDREKCQAWLADQYASLCDEKGFRRIKTFAEEHAPAAYAHNRLRALGLPAVNDAEALASAHISPDGVGVYWDADVLRLRKNHGESITLPTEMKGATLIFSDEKITFLEFDVLGNTDSVPIRLLVVGAHFKSGEDLKGEKKRVQQMQFVVERVQAILAADEGSDGGMLIPLMIMDSNNDAAYERAAAAELVKKEPDAPELVTLSKVVSAAGYVDVAGERHKSLKMRHAQGGQPKKFGDLMVDGIDKLLVPAQHRAAFSCVSDLRLASFAPAPAAAEAMLAAIRADPAKRDFLKRMIAGRSVHDEEKCGKMKLLFEAKVDEQTGATTNVHGVHSGEPWGDNMTENLKAMLAYPAEVQLQIEQSLGMKVIDLGSSLMQLYPNTHAPSDHPPVVLVLDRAKLSKNHHPRPSAPTAPARAGTGRTYLRTAALAEAFVSFLTCRRKRQVRPAK